MGNSNYMFQKRPSTLATCIPWWWNHVSCWSWSLRSPPSPRSPAYCPSTPLLPPSLPVQSTAVSSIGCFIKDFLAISYRRATNLTCKRLISLSCCRISSSSSFKEEAWSTDFSFSSEHAVRYLIRAIFALICIIRMCSNCTSRLSIFCANGKKQRELRQTA